MCIQYVIAGVQAVGAIAQGVAQAKAHKMEATIAQQQGLHSARVAAANAEAMRYAHMREAATRHLAVATAGVDPKSASAVDVLTEDWANRSQDVLNEYYKGRLALYDGNEKARLARASASQALTTSLLDVGGTLITKAAKENWFTQ